MKSVFSIVKKPLFTEKGAALKEKENKVLVEVGSHATKQEIKGAIETIFKVKVEKVATISVRARKKRLGRFEGTKPARKKALITLAEGQKLDFIEGA